MAFNQRNKINRIVPLIVKQKTLKGLGKEPEP